MSKKYLFIGGPKDGERLCTNGVPEVRFPSQISSLGEIKPDDVLSDTVYCLHESYGPSGQEVAFYAHRKLSYTDTLQMLIDNYQPKSVVSGEEVDWNKKIDWAKEPERMAERAELLKKVQAAVCNAYGIDVDALPSSKIFIGGIDINSASINELLDVSKKIEVGSAMSHTSIGCNPKYLGEVVVMDDNENEIAGLVLSNSFREYFDEKSGSFVRVPDESEKVPLIAVHESWLTNGTELAKRALQLSTGTVLVFDSLLAVNGVKAMRDDLGCEVISYVRPEENQFHVLGHRWCIKGQEDKIYPEGER